MRVGLNFAFQTFSQLVRGDIGAQPVFNKEETAKKEMCGLSVREALVMGLMGQAGNVLLAWHKCGRFHGFQDHYHALTS